MERVGLKFKSKKNGLPVREGDIMRKRSADEYINEFFANSKNLLIKIVNLETGEERFVDIATGIGVLSQEEIAIYPIGRKDKENKDLYQGDIVIAEIETKYGNIIRCGVIRTEGFWACGLDYFDEENYIEEEGDWIDDFYLENIYKIGNIFEVNLKGDFDWKRFVEEDEDESI